MKRLVLLAALFILITSVSSPMQDPFTDYVPVMMKREDLTNSVAVTSAQPLKKTGKLHKYNTTLFVVEPYKGIHMFNNTDPSNPVNLGFIRIPGCIDLVVKDNFLYADNAVDLVTLDISNQQNIKVVNRIQNTFPEILPPDNGRMPVVFSKEKRPKDLIIVEWKLNTVNQ